MSGLVSRALQRATSRVPSGYSDVSARPHAVEEQIRSEVLPHSGLLSLIFGCIPAARVGGQADQHASIDLCDDVRSRVQKTTLAGVLAQPLAEEVQPKQPGQISAEVSADGLDARAHAHDLGPVLGDSTHVAPRR